MCAFFAVVPNCTVFLWIYLKIGNLAVDIHVHNVYVS